jgi:hypothetical protein
MLYTIQNKTAPVVSRGGCKNKQQNHYRPDFRRMLIMTSTFANLTIEVGNDIIVTVFTYLYCIVQDCRNKI